MKIVENYKIWFSISLCIIAIGIGMFFVNGFNFGIDFQGGTMIQYDLKTSFDANDISEALKDLDLEEIIIKTGMNETADREVIIKTAKSLVSTDRKEIADILLDLYPEAEHRGTDQFSPSIGDEIKSKAVISILVAAVGMLIYITFRFEIVYGITAIIALIHDVLILLTVYVVFDIPISTAFIAAILTVVGYSINDTIVVFDRIRENVKAFRRPNYFEVANNSLKQTITRSINTSMTTLFVIGSLYFLGVDSIKELALPLLAGVLAGTYSSIFIASPLWALWKTKTSDKQKHYVAKK